MQYAIRDTDESDKQWLDNLRRDVYHDLVLAIWGEYSEERHMRHFSSCWEEGNIKIIEQGTSPVGMIQTLDSETGTEISEIQISPNFQGKGLATAIITDILASAETENKKVTLSTSLKNFGAFWLYQRLGFREVRRTDSKIYLEK